MIPIIPASISRSRDLLVKERSPSPERVPRIQLSHWQWKRRIRSGSPTYPSRNDGQHHHHHFQHRLDSSHPLSRRSLSLWFLSHHRHPILRFVCCSWYEPSFRDRCQFQHSLKHHSTDQTIDLRSHQLSLCDLSLSVCLLLELYQSCFS